MPYVNLHLAHYVQWILSSSWQDSIQSAQIQHTANNHQSSQRLVQSLQSIHARWFESYKPLPGNHGLGQKEPLGIAHARCQSIMYASHKEVNEHHLDPSYAGFQHKAA